MPENYASGAVDSCRTATVSVSGLRLGGKRPPPERVQVDLAAACREAYAPYREDFRDHFGGEDVEIDCAAQSAAATADPTLVAQTLWNLFGNELKYAAPFGRVKVRIEDGGGKVRVVFADEGPGMSPRDRRRAFDLVVITFSFAIFNGNGMEGALADIAGMLNFGGALVSEKALYYLGSYALLLVAAVIGATPLPKNLFLKFAGSDAGKKIMVVLQPVALTALLIICTAYLVDGSFNPFLYFRF